MDKIDGLIKNYLESRKTGVSGQREDAVYPRSEILYAYLTDKLEGAELQRMLDFLKNNPKAQELIVKARETMESESGWENEKVSGDLLRRAQGLMPSQRTAGSCPHCGKSITPFKKPLNAQRWMNALWLLLAAASFALSFVFRHYFMQFLAASVLAGMKGIVEMRATKTQILIYKAISGDGSSEEQRLHQHSSRL